jgi:hypothetical protein
LNGSALLLFCIEFNHILLESNAADSSGSEANSSEPVQMQFIKDIATITRFARTLLDNPSNTFNGDPACLGLDLYRGCWLTSEQAPSLALGKGITYH